MNRPKTQAIPPFPLRYAERMPETSLLGEYNEETQRLAGIEGFGGTATTSETATGGWGDTDTDSDSD